jgi:cellulase/cellobiase CelA1
MIMSKMMPVPGNEPISGGEEGDDPEKEKPDLPEIPDKPEIPEEPEKSEIPEEPEQPDIQGDCKLELKYTIDIWSSGYQINFKITNISEEQSSGWTLKIKKKYINVAQSWCVNVEEDGEYYVFTPLSWNSTLAPGQSTEFGIIGNGDPSGGLDYSFSDNNN